MGPDIIKDGHAVVIFCAYFKQAQPTMYYWRRSRLRQSQNVAACASCEIMPARVCRIAEEAMRAVASGTDRHHLAQRSYRAIMMLQQNKLVALNGHREASRALKIL